MTMLMDPRSAGRSGDTISPRTICVDGNDATTRVAYALSEVIAIYPITPASSMGEISDAWAAAGKPNLWGGVPEVIEMQSEAGAAGAVHGALQRGSLATTFTASQGLLLMIPNMYKIAGELTPAVIHVAARTLATHALSIFGDHSDVMAARSTGWAMLASSSVQEAQDLALVAHAATLRSRIPFLHFFDGFRTSHEVNTITALGDDDIRALIDEADVTAHRARGLTPDAPVLRGSAQNPDVFFQAREAINPYYDALSGHVQDAMDRLAAQVGRRYNLIDYHGHPQADRVIVMMGSGAGAAAEAVDRMNAEGERVGLVSVRLFRPFPSEAFIAALPETVVSVAVLDRTKEPGAVGEPLYQDVVTTLAETSSTRPNIIGGRYGLSSKEFTPAMVKGVFDRLASEAPARRFTVGIVDDVTHLSITYDPMFQTEPPGLRAQFYGLGSDGSVGAAKNTVKIIAEGTELNAQGYFVYDSKKSGSTTVSHVRASPEPIRSTYLIQQTDFVSCSRFSLLRRLDVLKDAAPGAKVLVNAPFDAEEVWDQLPKKVRAQIVERDLDLYVVDAQAVAAELGLGLRINTIMQSCFFALSGVLPQEQARAAMKEAISKTYRKSGEIVVERNRAAVDRAATALQRVVTGPHPGSAESDVQTRALDDRNGFVERVTARLLAGEGDLLPVSALPVDGTFPTGTAAIEKRGIAQEIPIWDSDICIDCGHCALVCPHAAIRMNVFDPEALDGAPSGFKSKDFHSKELQGKRLTVQVAPLDCTGCGICVDICPVKSKTEVKHKALNMAPIEDHLEAESTAWDFFTTLPTLDKMALDPSTIKGSQVRLPLFEFSGACAGCGETPYLKLLTQLFGDRMLVANATGCSSIYGGNLPTTPWSTDPDGRGPAWANSLFEDNAEFGLGMRLGLDQQMGEAARLLRNLSPLIGEELVDTILTAEQDDDAGVAEQRELVEALKGILRETEGDEATRLLEISDTLVKKNVWIIGGDGWAYDIGSGGLDHVLASGRNVNILVLDTEVYSNTGGQASKATPRGAVAKFASRGKKTMKKDLGLIAAAYGDVYVAQIALGANYNQALKALLEAEAWDGPSLIIAYSTCIAHGIDMATSMTHQKDAVKSGYWPLFRFKPGSEEHEHPFQLDSGAPSMPLRDFTAKEGRFAMLERGNPETAGSLLQIAQGDVHERRRLYEQMAGVERTLTPSDPDGGEDDG